jgi:hypothetical protein
MIQITFLVSLESSRGGGVHRLGFMAFGLAMQKFLNIELIFHLKFNLSVNFKKSVENVVTLGPMA